MLFKELLPQIKRISTLSKKKLKVMSIRVILFNHVVLLELLLT